MTSATYEALPYNSKGRRHKISKMTYAKKQRVHCINKTFKTVEEYVAFKNSGPSQSEK